ncbi:MAG: hypothetical protein U1E76_06620 [Planctomycetota bacterium]
MGQFRLAAALVLGLLSAACSTPESSYNRAPEWVRKAGGLYDDGGKSVIYAVGIADKSPSIQWQQTMALNNSRVEMARVLQTYVQAMITNYMRSAKDYYNEQETASLVQNTEDVSRSITQGAILGAQQINSYKDERDGTLYMFMKLDLNNDFMKTYSEKSKAALREHFAKYSKELKEDALNEMDKAIQGSMQQMQQEAQPYATAPARTK